MYEDVVESAKRSFVQRTSQHPPFSLPLSDTGKEKPHNISRIFAY